MSTSWLSCGSLAMCLLLGAGPGGAEPVGPAEPPEAAVADGARADLPAAGEPLVAARWREGELLEDQLGTFELLGERVLFTLASRQQALPVLENLALERVTRLLDQRADCPWVVTGTVTEYRGRNYLLLQRAVMRPTDTRPTRPAPDPPRS